MTAKSNGVKNIIICGVGGQGIILASDILCYAAFQEGCDVKKSEIHGMAQRGGSVITHVRFGDKVFSPLIEIGRADYILAFEKLEALRYAHYAGRACVFVVNELTLPPMTVLTGAAEYPGNIAKKLEQYGSVNLLDATVVAQKLQNSKVVNTVLLGGLARFLNFNNASWTAAIRKCVKEKFVDLNIQAFTEGKASIL